MILRVIEINNKNEIFLSNLSFTLSLDQPPLISKLLLINDCAFLLLTISIVVLSFESNLFDNNSMQFTATDGSVFSSRAEYRRYEMETQYTFRDK